MTVLAAAFALLLAGAPDPTALLAEVDRAANQAKDARLTLSLEVRDKGGDPLQRKLLVWQRGPEHRMVKFAAPARLRGTGILAIKDQTWLYTASYKRVRRVAGKQGSGSWMGTGFSVRDLVRARFSDDYVPTLEGETEQTWRLRLTPRERDEHDHASLLIEVRKVDHLVTRIEARNSDDSVKRVMVASDFRKVGAYVIAHTIELEDKASGKTTRAALSNVAFDSGLNEGFFSLRELQRSP